MVASAYAAMRAARPYRPALSEGEALRELAAGAGKQFDPTLAMTLMAAVRDQETDERRPATG
jgi:HD-GYP domain-containing protein (c-di-GMP phosphodiesterase class II)